MRLRSSAVATDLRACQWLNLREALHHFGTYPGATQSQAHIKPLHWYVACRLVIACKGMTAAFRNLTNRMEETIGECTNLHITYPAMVFGYMFVIRANRDVAALAAELTPDAASPARQLAANDVAVQEGGEPVESIFRFHSALRELTGRRGIRNDVSRYEAVALAMIVPSGDRAGDVLENFPPVDSPLRLEQFFQTLYLRYEERYLFGAPDLKPVTRLGTAKGSRCTTLQCLALAIMILPASQFT